MAFLSRIFNNAKKPTIFFGNMLLNRMNSGTHAELSSWAFENFSVPISGNLLDIGCGGGANIARLLQRSKDAKVYGIDYSPVSVRKSRKFNMEAVRQGRCTLLEGNVSSLPFSDGQFSLVTAFETIYFWPDIEYCFKEVLRVVSEGAHFCIVNESDGHQETDKKWERVIDGMHTYNGEEVKTHLENVGFRNVRVVSGSGKPWLLVDAEK